MILNIQDDILKLHSMGLLDKLLLDKTTGKRVMWATDAYASLGSRYERNEEIKPELITGANAGIIKTRARKELEQQSSRTRQRGEVATPLWVCQKMCAYVDEILGSKADWKKYADARVLELTCGEAPFLVSRYNAETGEAIPVQERIGLLDRKLRAVNKNAATEEEWLKWAFRAFHATYGYEFQGDNLLIARVNLLMTFREYLRERWQREPAMAEWKKISNIVCWNIWQMDGLHGTIPYGTAEEEYQQVDFFQLMGGFGAGQDEEEKQPPCRVKKWRCDGLSFEFMKLPVRGKYPMKFDFVIGNPPYHEDVKNKGDRSNPIYDKFMDAAFQIGNVAIMIHPARFLFDAGQTPKAWNQKMLQDDHFTVLHYEPNAERIFKNTEIKGGVAITLHNSNISYGAIETFIPYDELNSIVRKVHRACVGCPMLDSIIASQGLFRFSQKLFTEHPEVRKFMGAGTGSKIVSTAIEKASDVFVDIKQGDDVYVRFLGRVGNKRVYKYIKREYLEENEYIDAFKLFMPEANNSGKYGETLTEPFIGYPGEGSSDTFLSAGIFKSKYEPEMFIKYIKTKFFRSLLGVRKVTQHCSPRVWKMIPLQDFTPASDIDWSKSIPEIDQQLYAKYGLDENEIQFIETHVKEMT